MSEVQSPEAAKRDPRRLRALMERAAVLKRDHGVSSVFVGIAGREGDLMVPEFIAFVEASLRVEDSIFTLTRERAVVLLADVDREQAQRILGRVTSEFQTRFPRSTYFDAAVRCYEVSSGSPHPTAKEILPVIFGSGHRTALA